MLMGAIALDGPWYLAQVFHDDPIYPSFSFTLTTNHVIVSGVSYTYLEAVVPRVEDAISYMTMGTGVSVAASFFLAAHGFFGSFLEIRSQAARQRALRNFYKITPIAASLFILAGSLTAFLGPLYLPSAFMKDHVFWQLSNGVYSCNILSSDFNNCKWWVSNSSLEEGVKVEVWPDSSWFLMGVSSALGGVALLFSITRWKRLALDSDFLTYKQIFFADHTRQMGEYYLERTLLRRKGLSKAVLGEHVRNKQEVVIKIYPKEAYRVQVRNQPGGRSRVSQSMSERVLCRLAHRGVGRLLQLDWDALYQKQNGKRYKALVLVEELGKGGNLFDLIAYIGGGGVGGGGLPEKVARTFFHQLIDAMSYCHQRRAYHLNLRPEHLNLDRHYALKVTGFATSPLFHSGLVTAIKQQKPKPSELLTSPYTMPEGKITKASKVSSRALLGSPRSGGLTPHSPHSLHSPREGREVRERDSLLNETWVQCELADCWAAGVLLFIMLTGRLPFKTASKTDWYYSRLSHVMDTKPFWEAHEVLSKNKLSDPAKMLLAKLLHPDPALRKGLSASVIEAIMSDPWFSLGTLSELELRKFMENSLARADDLHCAEPDFDHAQSKAMESDRHIDVFHSLHQPQRLLSLGGSNLDVDKYLPPSLWEARSEGLKRRLSFRMRADAPLAALPMSRPARKNNTQQQQQQQQICPLLKANAECFFADPAHHRQFAHPQEHDGQRYRTLSTIERNKGMTGGEGIVDNAPPYDTSGWAIYTRVFTTKPPTLMLSLLTAYLEQKTEAVLLVEHHLKQITVAWDQIEFLINVYLLPTNRQEVAPKRSVWSPRSKPRKSGNESGGHTPRSAGPLSSAAGLGLPSPSSLMASCTHVLQFRRLHGDMFVFRAMYLKLIGVVFSADPRQVI